MSSPRLFSPDLCRIRRNGEALMLRQCVEEQDPRPRNSFILSWGLPKAVIYVYLPGGW